MLESGSKFKSNIPSCIICKCQYDSYYRIPRVIPRCGHTFCEKCINNNVQSKGNRKIFVCVECQSQTIIRKGAADDVPKNIGILDIVKSLKKKQLEQASPMSQKSPQKYSPVKAKNYCKQHSNKQLDLICQTCNYEKVCSICVLLGNIHIDHKFIEHIPASNVDLKQVKQVFSIIQDSIKETILPNSQFNILKKAEQHLINSLIETIKTFFKQHYYKVIQKKQLQVIAQCKQIKFQGGISRRLQQIAKHYDLIKNQYDQIYAHNYNRLGKQNLPPLETVQSFIQQCKNLHNQIEIFSENTEKQSKNLFSTISTKINQSQYFRLAEMPFSLKSVIQDKNDVISPSKYNNKVEQISNSQNTKKVKTNGVEFDIKSTKNSQKLKNFNNHQQQVISGEYFQNLNQDQQRKPFTVNSFNTKNKSSFMPPKNKTNKSQAGNSKTEIKQKQEQLIPMLDLNSKLKQKKSSNIGKKTSSNTQRVNKSSFDNIVAQPKISVQKSNHNGSSSTQNNRLNMSHVLKIQGIGNDDGNLNEKELKIKQMKPLKQIPLNLKGKFSTIVKQITRQSQGHILELIGMQINDALIVYVCDYLKSKRLNFSMIKLVKNTLTDEGLSILLGYLIKSESVQVLNLTSNQLTLKSLELILSMGSENRFLKTIYLSHNKISKMNLKGKQKQLDEVGIEIII